MLPPHLPILDTRMARGDYRPVYEEREISEPVALCDARGALNPAAVGWSRRPLVTANLRGHWPRKKRWNFWSFVSREFVFSVTVADIDFASFCGVFFIDFASGEKVETTEVRRSGFTRLPEEVERTVVWESTRIRHAATQDAQDGMHVEFECADVAGTPLRASFDVHRPPGHESLNVVVPWTRTRFQLNSKHNTLPCKGGLEVGGRRYEMRPRECHAVQDWGRGIWPHRSHWNWAVCTGEQDGRLVGVNMGDKWTTGTGSNENGICLDGRLYKIMEDLDWSYVAGDWMKPWRVRSRHSDAVDLTFAPFFAKTSSLNLGIVATGGTCCFGTWRGVIRAAGEAVEIRDLVGWAEEFAHRW